MNVVQATDQNQRYSQSLNWNSRRTEINVFLGFPNRFPTEEEFSAAVGQWQRGEPGLEPDGVLGPASWRRMAHQLDHSSRGRIGQWSHRSLRGTLLTGFDFDDATLKPEHEQWLASFADRHINSARGTIYILGLTDRTGTESYNRQLSWRRASAANRFLMRRYRASIPIQVAGLGESLAGAASDRAESDRGVAVAYSVSPRPLEWLRYSPEPATTFYIRELNAFAVGASIRGIPGNVNTTVMTLQISDGMWSNFYQLNMLGFGVSVGRGFFPVGVTVTDTGPWHIFRLSRPRTVNDFVAATARYSSGGASAGGGATGVGTLQVQFRNPDFRIRPFKLGAQLTTNLVSVSAASGFGLLERQRRRAIQEGVPTAIRTSLLRHGSRSKFGGQ